MPLIHAKFTLLPIAAFCFGLASQPLLACNEHKADKAMPAATTAMPMMALTAATTEDAVVKVANPRIRAVAETQKVTGAFMVLSNPTDQDAVIVAADSPIANVTELHETRMNENGVMKMHKIDTMIVPAQGQLELKPGSFHIMLIDLKQQPESGKSYPVTLTFANGKTQVVEAPVMDIMH